MKPTDENFECTEGLALLWGLTAQADNVVFHSHEAELENMSYFEAEYRWSAVCGSNGSVTIRVPCLGAYYPAVVVYDGDQPLVSAGIEMPPGPCSYEMSIDGKVVGRFFPKENDNRQRLFFLTHPVEFQGGERLTLRTGPTGGHLTEDILLLRTKPLLRKREFAIEQIEAGFVRLEGRDAMRLTWITTWPSQCTIRYSASSDHMKAITEEEPLANHRLYVTDLEPNADCLYRIIAPRPDGTEVQSAEMTFRFSAPSRPEDQLSRASVPLRVENPHGFDVRGYPVSSGVPFAQGELSDAAWTKAAVLGPFLNYVVARAKELDAATTALMTCDEDCLYVGFRCDDPDMEHLASAKFQDDQVGWLNDVVDVAIADDEKRTAYYHIRINCDNDRWDSLTSAGREVYGKDSSWTGEYQTATARAEAHWSVEIAIPWTTLDMAPRKPGDTLSGNLIRRTHRRPGGVNEFSSWSESRRARYVEAENFGTWVFE